MRGVVLSLFILQLANAQEPVRLSVDRSGRISWTGQYTHSYQLQSAARLENPVWTDVGPAALGGAGTIQVTNTFSDAAQMFYRVVATTNAFPCTNSGAANCASAVSLGQFAADTALRQGFSCVPAMCVQVAQRSGCGSAWFSIRLLETSDCPAALRVKAELQSPPGANYDLFLYLETCDSLRAVSQRSGDQLDTVVTGPPDRSQFDDSTTAWIEVRYISGSEPGNWDLRVMTRACSD